MNWTYLQREDDPYGSHEIAKLHMIKDDKSYMHLKHTMNEYIPVIKSTTIEIRMKWMMKI